MKSPRVSLATLEILEQRIAPATLVGLDDNNHLLTFDSASPGAVSSTIAVSGLGAGETLIGIDVRPATGAMYGIAIDGANGGHIYLINPATGAAALSSNVTGATLSGSNFGVDFNPVADLLRVVSDTSQNLRINVDTGAATLDGSINPAGSMLSGAAYMNSFAGAGSTQLFDIDVANDRLVLQNPPNGGAISTVGAGLGIDVTGAGGFDILSIRNAAGVVTNTGFAALTVGGVAGLYNIDLATGQASDLGSIGDGSVPLLGLTALMAAPSANAFAIEAATGHLLKLNTATPNNATDVGLITVAGAPGESLIGFDFRPANGVLYAATKSADGTGRLYTVDTATGAATFLFTLAADGTDTTLPYTGLSGAQFGVDFNPVADRLRIVSNTGEDLRINVATGLVITDTALSGGTAAAVGAAYTNSFGGATSTTLYDIDAVTDSLYLQNPPNNGTLTKVGSGLGVGNVTAVGGFDIRPNGEAYATLTVGGTTALYHVDLTTGAASPIGTVGAGNFLTGLALAPSGSIQFANPVVAVSEDGTVATLTLNRTGGADGAVSVLVNTNGGTATAGPDYTVPPQVVTFAAGVTTQTITIPIVNDAFAEGTETFLATLSGATGGAALGTQKTATVNILDNDANLIGLDNANHLLIFSSGDASSIVDTIAVKGLGAGETLVGIDHRPANGLLYGLTKDNANAGKLYAINAVTGAAAFVTALSANPADDSPGNPFYTTLSGSSFGLDFNPSADRLRVISDSGQNLRINVDNGQVTTDLDLNPASGGAAGAAYTNSFAGATGTALYEIDVANDTLALQNPPNSGTVTNVGALGVDAAGDSGFDIVSSRASDGTIANFGYASLTVGGVTGLYSIDLSNGAAALLTTIGDGSTSLAGLTASLAGPGAKAFTIDSTNTLSSFNTATPSVTTSIGTLTGLGGGEAVIGFDFRPSNGTLYAVTRDGNHSGRLYTVNTATAAASLVAQLAANPADFTDPYPSLIGVSYGVDFNPVEDLLRIVSDNGQSLLVDPANGLVTTEGALNGAAGGATGAAYANNVSGAAGTALYGIDPQTDALYLVSFPMNGTLSTIGALGVGDVTAVGGFDIRANGEAFATLTVNGATGLYGINLQTGHASLVGPLGVNGAATHLGLALVPGGTLQLASPTGTVSEGGTQTLTINRIGGADGITSVTVNFTGGTATPGTDFDGGSRLITFAANETTKTLNVATFDDAVYEGNETFTAILAAPTGSAGRNSLNLSTITITDNETIPTLSIGDVAQVEGNIAVTGPVLPGAPGTVSLFFPVTLSGVTQTDVVFDYDTLTGTADAADFVGLSGHNFSIKAGMTSGIIAVTIKGDTIAEANETLSVKLSHVSNNAVLADGTGIGTILNDDASSIRGNTATYVDADGDLVTVKTSNGTLTAGSLVFRPAGNLGGLQLTKLNLPGTLFPKANVSITAKPGPAGGDGFVNVGFIDAHDNSLGIVLLKGDLGQIDAINVKSLLVQSIGQLGLATQGAGGSLLSNITGTLSALTVQTDIKEATVIAANLGIIRVLGDVIGGAGDHSGSLEALNRIGVLAIGGVLRGGADAQSGSIIAKTVGAMSVHGIEGGRIFVQGNPIVGAATPANVSLSKALGLLRITGSVSDANILVGFDREGLGVNADVSTGPIAVYGDWVASNLSVGVKAGTDGFYGSDTGGLITNANGAVVSRIASIAIRGQVLGTASDSTDRFGFVAEQIGSFRVGATLVPLSSKAGSPADNRLIGSTGETVIREYFL